MADLTDASHTATDALEESITTATTQAIEAVNATAAKDDLRASGIALLNAAASWAEDNVKVPLKLSKVYTLQATATPTTSIAQFTDLAISFGDGPGELDTMWKSVDRAMSYELQWRLAAAGTWTLAKTANKSRTRLIDLPSAPCIQIRARALGPNDIQGPWSDPGEHLVP